MELYKNTAQEGLNSMGKTKAWKELSRKTVFEKFSRKVEQVVFELPDGNQADFFIKAEGPTACVLALTDKNEVILVREYRPGPKAILDEMPGGFVDPGEDPTGAAQREFREETGYDGDFEFVGTCLDDAYSTMERYCFVAKNCKKVGNPKDTKTEHTEIVLVSLQEFRNRLRKGRMTDVEVGYMALDYLGLLVAKE